LSFGLGAALLHEFYTRPIRTPGSRRTVGLLKPLHRNVHVSRLDFDQASAVVGAFAGSRRGAATCLITAREIEPI
jgi:hypothetical protein